MTTSPTDAGPEDGEVVHEPVTAKEGWRRFVDQPATPPAVDAAPDDEVAAVVEEARLAYHSRLAVVATPTVQQVSVAGRRLVVLNRHQLSARRGLIVTGAAGTGKTTAITQLGKAHELALRLRHPDHGPRIPVVYVTVPPASTARMLAVEFARFLGASERSHGLTSTASTIRPSAARGSDSDASARRRRSDPRRP